MDRLAFRLALGTVVLAALSACAVPVTRTVRTIDGPPPPPHVEPAPLYGTVTRIDEIDTRVAPTGGGAALGAVVGGVIGNQFGSGSGRAAATALGIFGGAVVGNNVEHQQAAAASSVVYRVFVRFDDGSHRSFDYSGLDGLHRGERVRLEHGQLQRG